MKKINPNEFVDFSNQLIVSNDIDPDYIFIKNFREEFGEQEAFEIVKKKLLIYNLRFELLYHIGAIVESEIKFGSERQKQKNNFLKWYNGLRHLRLDALQKFNKVDYLIFKREFSKLNGMGAWASWKCADILDKVFNIKMIYAHDVFLSAYEYPIKGLLMLNNTEEDVKIYSNKAVFNRHMSFAKTLSVQITKEGIWNAENVLELETLLCKYHSFKHNKYRIGQDIEHVRKIKDDVRLKAYHHLLP